MINSHHQAKSKNFTIFPLSTLIRTTLLLLYLAIVLPLPLLAPNNLRVMIVYLLLLGIILLWGILCERIIINSSSITGKYPLWCLWSSSSKWEINWSKVSKLLEVKSSQGGRVYYIIFEENKAHLLPQRISRFNEFVNQFIKLSGISTTFINKLTPPWTYQLLAIISSFMIICELLIFFSL